MKKIKLISVITLGAFVLVFILQNWAVVPLQFLFWSFEVPRLLLVIALLLVGFMIGIIYSTFTRD